MNNMLLSKFRSSPFFIFDVESIGLFGEPFAVGGGVYIGGAAHYEFRYSFLHTNAKGCDDDRQWILENVPIIGVTHVLPQHVVNMLWYEWQKARTMYPGIIMAAECGWPIEANILHRTVVFNINERKWNGPYPLHEIASFMVAAGMDPMAKYERNKSELPEHDPLADSRLSARLLFEALERIASLYEFAPDDQAGWKCLRCGHKNGAWRKLTCQYCHADKPDVSLQQAGGAK